MNEKGFIKIDRKIVDWEWYQSPNTMLLFIHCIISANHTGKKWKGKSIERGQFITSLDRLSFETGLSKKSVRTALKHLVESDAINVDTSTHQYSLITIVKYGLYQDYIADKGTPNGTLNGTQRAHRTALTKETKEYKEYITSSSTPTLEDIETYIKDNNLNVNAIKFFNYYQSKGWKYRNKPIDYKKKLEEWHRTERPEKISNFSNQRNYTHEQLEEMTRRKLAK